MRILLPFFLFALLLPFTGSDVFPADDLFDQSAAATHLQKGRQLLAKRNFEKAIAELEEAANISPDAETFYYLGYAWYGKAKSRKGDTESMRTAQEHFATAYELDPHYTPSSPELLQALQRKAPARNASNEEAERPAQRQPEAAAPPQPVSSGASSVPAVIEETVVDAIFRGDAQRTGRYSASGVPQLKGEKWNFGTRDQVLSSPVAVDGVVYLTDNNGFTYALDAASGKEKWRLFTGAFITSSPVVANNTYFVGGGDNKLAAVNLRTGQKKWEFKTGWEVRSSPLISNNTVYFGSLDKNFYAVDAEKGQLKWKFAAGGAITSSPALAEGVVFFGTDDSHFYAVDAGSGKVKWKIDVKGAVRSTPVVADDQVVFKCEGAYSASPRNETDLIAVDRLTGKGKWNIPTLKNLKRISVDERRVAQWMQEEAGNNVSFVSSPAFENGVIYFGSADGWLYAVEAATGKEKWQFETGKELAAVSAPASRYSAPPLWTFYRLGGIVSSPALAGGVVYVGSADGNLYAVDEETGQERWRFRSGGAIQSSPAVSDGVVYFGNNARKVYAVE